MTTWALLLVAMDWQPLAERAVHAASEVTGWLLPASPAPGGGGGGGVPDPGGGTIPDGVSEKVIKILSWLKWLATAAGVAGVLITAAKMAIAHRRGDDTNVAGLGWVMGACVLIGAAPWLVGALV